MRKKPTIQLFDQHTGAKTLISTETEETQDTAVTQEEPDLDFDEADEGGISREEFLLLKFRKLTAETHIKEEQQELERLKKEKQLGLLIPVTDVTEAFQALGSLTKNRLARLVSELPPRLEGLPGTDMISIIREAVDSVLLDLYTELKLPEKED